MVFRVRVWFYLLIQWRVMGGNLSEKRKRRRKKVKLLMGINVIDFTSISEYIIEYNLLFIIYFIYLYIYRRIKLESSVKD